MPTKQSSVEVTIAERKLKIACPIGEESALLAAAAEVNLRCSKITQSKNISSAEQAMLMSALNLAHDLATAKAKLSQERLENKSKIKLLQNTIEQALNTPNIKRA